MSYELVAESIMEYIESRIQKLFPTNQHHEAKRLIESIRAEHVMDTGSYNLFNTRIATLELSKGSLESLREFVDEAKKDFRNVIYWYLNQSDKTQG
ncbi:hypothetical protein FUAX_19290 [Fulvitalea axinellae]|uniref:Uncharacterized protein n=1 Tax=Fulvitalea axinellae TaxID=1182444 RepID=A0AAU9CR92_9BACT|nr:hypothetical protein FUAX_19290 [Fulvitalea axinellae]